MNLIWHIVKKDLRRFWLPIALLAVVLFIKAEFLMKATHLAQIAASGAGPYTPEPVALNSAAAMNLIYQIEVKSHLRAMMLWVVCASDIVLLIVLVLGVLLEDPPLGERTFWRTRPVTGRQILAAKVIFILLIAWPLQAAMQVWINQVGRVPEGIWHDPLGALTLIQAGWISLTVLAAVLWRNPLVGAGVLFAVFASLLTLLLLAVIYLGYDNNNRVMFAVNHLGYFYNDIAQTQIVAASFAGFVTTLLAAWWMYCERRRQTGFLILAAGLTAIILLLV